MKTWFLYILLFVSSVSFGQNTKQEIEKAMDAFDNALMLKDSNALKTLLHDSVQYKHSNGWIQTKKDVIGDFFNGKINYGSIAVEQPVTIEEKNGKWFSKFNAVIKGEVDTKAFEVHLKVEQTWVKQNNDWKMIDRKAVKQE